MGLRPGTVVYGVTVGENLEWQGVVVWINLLCTGGWRKEAIGIEPGEVFGPRKLRLSSALYLLSNVWTAD